MTLEELRQWMRESKLIHHEHFADADGSMHQSFIYEHKGELYLLDKQDDYYYPEYGVKPTSYQPLKVFERKRTVVEISYVDKDGCEVCVTRNEYPVSPKKNYDPIATTTIEQMQQDFAKVDALYNNSFDPASDYGQRLTKREACAKFLNLPLDHQLVDWYHMMHQHRIGQPTAIVYRVELDIEEQAKRRNK